MLADERPSKACYLLSESPCMGVTQQSSPVHVLTFDFDFVCRYEVTRNPQGKLWDGAIVNRAYSKKMHTESDNDEPSNPNHEDNE